MNSKTNILIIDPIRFRGGSKVSTETILRQIDLHKFDITVLSADKNSWNSPSIRKLKIFEPKYFRKMEQGIPYFIKHTILSLNIALAIFRTRNTKIVMGVSGPGVDLSIYLIKRIFNYKIVQFVHGDVAHSKTIGRCLSSSDRTFYLPSAYPSIKKALSAVGYSDTTWSKSKNVNELKNGICRSQWPSPCQYKTPTILWASSLLKWKGLDILLEALNSINVDNRPNTHICFIKPLDIQLPISDYLMDIEKVKWHEEPNNLDDIRASSNIFISTSRNEPFGLSILEAMASGHCVMIPADNSYWDKTLYHNKNCIKYTPFDSIDLGSKIQFLQKNPDIVKRIGMSAQGVALKYRAEDLQLPIISAINKIHYTAHSAT
ncbi:hypothetical protein A9Q81_15590 [Gammaproteobacteria bacterium 42_54_T18]|nr:hypothetical protein A9Q81_15590 [Gammaproteobacteria bacterium 42_54_T18]